MKSFGWCNYRTFRDATAKYRFHASQFSVYNGNFPNFRATFRQGTVIAPMQYLYYKEAKGV